MTAALRWFFSTAIHSLLALPDSVKAMLSHLCCLNSVPDLSTAEPDAPNQTQDEFAAHWSQLWSSASLAVLATCSHETRQQPINDPQISTRLAAQQRLQLAFSHHVSCVQHLMVCRRLGGESDADSAFALPAIAFRKSTMRLIAIVLFLLFKSDLTREKPLCLLSV